MIATYFIKVIMQLGTKSRPLPPKTPKKLK